MSGTNDESSLDFIAQHTVLPGSVANSGRMCAAASKKRRWAVQEVAPSQSLSDPVSQPRIRQQAKSLPMTELQPSRLTEGANESMLHSKKQASQTGLGGATNTTPQVQHTGTAAWQLVAQQELNRGQRTSSHELWHQEVSGTSAAADSRFWSMPVLQSAPNPFELGIASDPPGISRAGGDDNSQFAEAELLRRRESRQRGLSDETSIIQSLTAEQGRLRLSKQQTFRKILELSQLHALQQENESRVRALMERVQEVLTTKPSPRDGTAIGSMADLIDDINTARGFTTPACSIFSRLIADKIPKLAQMTTLQQYLSHYMCKFDVLQKSSCFQEMLHFLAGASSAGEVVMEMSFGTFRGHKYKLKELAALDIADFSHLCKEYRRANRFELLWQVESAVTEEAKAEASERVTLASIEMIVAVYLFVFGSGQESCDFSTSSSFTCWPHDRVEGSEEALADSQTTFIVNKTALHAMQISEEQLALMWAIEERKFEAKAMLKARLTALQDQLSGLVGELPELWGKYTNCSNLMETVGSLQHLIIDVRILETLSSFSCSSILTPVQAAHTLAASYPLLPNISFMYEEGLLPQPDPARLQAFQPLGLCIVQEIVG